MFQIFINNMNAYQLENNLIYYDSFIKYYLTLKKNKLDHCIFLWKYSHDIQLRHKNQGAEKYIQLSIYVKQSGKSVFYMCPLYLYVYVSDSIYT